MAKPSGHDVDVYGGLKPSAWFPSRTLWRFLGSVAVLPPIMAAPMVASLRLAELQVRLVSG
jgi:hypothetical protein